MVKTVENYDPHPSRGHINPLLREKPCNPEGDQKSKNPSETKGDCLNTKAAHTLKKSLSAACNGSENSVQYDKTQSIKKTYSLACLCK